MPDSLEADRLLLQEDPIRSKMLRPHPLNEQVPHGRLQVQLDAAASEVPKFFVPGGANVRLQPLLGGLTKREVLKRQLAAFELSEFALRLLEIRAQCRLNHPAALNLPVVVA